MLDDESMFSPSWKSFSKPKQERKQQKPHKTESLRSAVLVVLLLLVPPIVFLSVIREVVWWAVGH